MKYLHIVCLQEWLKSRMISKHTDQSLHYCWKALDCELCKQTLPSTVTVRNKTYNLISMACPDSPFIILESFRRDQTVPRGVHLIKFLDMKPVVIGRGNECDARLSNDISVSRCHASIRLIKEGLLLEDRASKFGTLLLKRKPFVLSQGGSITLQVDRTVLHISFPVTWSFKSFCARLCCRKVNRVRNISSSLLEYSTLEPAVADSSRPLNSTQLAPVLRLQSNIYTLEHLPLETDPQHLSQQLPIGQDADSPPHAEDLMVELMSLSGTAAPRAIQESLVVSRCEGRKMSV